MGARCVRGAAGPAPGATKACCRCPWFLCLIPDACGPSAENSGMQPIEPFAPSATNLLSPIGRHRNFASQRTRRGAFVQKSQRPNAGPSAYFRNRQNLLAVTVSAALLAGIASANALPLTQQYEVGRSAKPNGAVLASRDKSSSKVKPAAEDVAARAKGILSVVIAIDRQQVTLYSDGHPIARSRVSTGVPGHPTPTGVFSIIQKDRWHRSNIYYNAPMYFMQRVTWSGLAMHQGVVPNSPASHGCIRLPGSFARQMWGITKLGVRVIVARSEVTPAAISNERLFTVKQGEP